MINLILIEFAGHNSKYIFENVSIVFNSLIKKINEDKIFKTSNNLSQYSRGNNCSHYYIDLWLEPIKRNNVSHLICEDYSKQLKNIIGTLLPLPNVEIRYWEK